MSLSNLSSGVITGRRLGTRRGEVMPVVEALETGFLVGWLTGRGRTTNPSIDLTRFTILNSSILAN